MNTVKVLIPIYKADFAELEMRSLQQVCQVLHKYPLVVVKPQSLDLSALSEKFPQLTFEAFDDAYFQGIPGYNRLMLSREFYGRFLDTRYMLIYQLDAYVFRDELTEWCMKGYDYIGAPWLKRPFYNGVILSTIMKLSLAYDQLREKPSKQSLYNKIGNGGFSLRNVNSHYRSIETYRKEIDFFLKQKRSHFYNEDVFFATIPDFIYPDPMEALKFGFDKYPEYCFHLNNGQLPFGCHAWYKTKMRNFWKPIIKFQ